MEDPEFEEWWLKLERVEWKNPERHRVIRKKIREDDESSDLYERMMENYESE